MKLIKYILLSLSFITFNGCNEDKILEEIPLDFTTVENSFLTPENFEASVAQLYNQARRYSAPGDQSNPVDCDFFLGTDVMYHGRAFTSDTYSRYDSFGADNNDVRERWQWAFKMVNNANTIISRIETIEFDSDSQKNRLITEARFFRAWAYRALTYLFGDVPLILEEIPSAKRDFVRAPKADVYAAIIDDLEFASTNLPDVDTVEDGRLTKDAARHFLAELYIVIGENQKAVNVASEVIDSGNYNLMQNRFGSRKDEKGDVYWDLFRLNNQNRSAGNREGVWVFQIEYETPGGYGQPNGPAFFWERYIGPEYNRFRAKGDNVFSFIYESTYHGGRGQGNLRPTSHVTHGIWNNVGPNDYDDDIRNSDNNVLRKWWIDNPLSIHYGDTINLRTNSKLAYETYLETATIENDSNRYLYPVFLKQIQINNHFEPDLVVGSANNLTPAQEPLATQAHKDLIASYNGIGPRMSFNGRRVYRDQYAVRLSETLLLRAEAYMNLGGAANLDLAAADINQIRNRANASQITGPEVTIDFILDERLRELLLEEPRRLTLNRLGLLYDRTKRYNFYASGSVQPHNNLYPIPSVERQNNTEAELGQNTGYN